VLHGVGVDLIERHGSIVHLHQHNRSAPINSSIIGRTCPLLGTSAWSDLRGLN
jgi:hypothetical protein